jgi:hypothetical protein
MILFSQRLKLEKIFDKWCKENCVRNCPINLVAFLDIRGLINEEKFLEFLNSTEVTENND